MLKNCQVVFLTRPQGVFFSGEQVIGRISISLEKHKKVQEIGITVSGSAKCHWTESKGSGKNRRTVFYKGNEIYFETYSTLLSSHHLPDGSSVLSPGVHSFDFAFTLPLNLPSSYEGSYGRIRYMACIKTKRPYRLDESDKTYFTVLSNVDLNNMSPHLRIPISRSIGKTFSTFFSSNGQLDMNVIIPVGGFVPGQTIPIQYVINNNSKVKINEIKFKLQKAIEFTCTHPYLKQRTEKIKVSQTLGAGVGKGKSQTCNVNIDIPALPPSNPGLSSIIKIKYSLKVQVVVSGMHTNLRDEIPIVIGSVPLTPLNNNNNNQNTNNYYHVGESSSSFQPSAPPAYSEFAPPTYQEAQGFQRMAEEHGEEADDTMYNPKYLFYPPKAKIGFT